MSQDVETPPFPDQQQEAPGTTAAMEPRPDHGEGSYRGSGLLEGYGTVITGGDSGIGRAVAIAFAREGADVLISYLNEHEDARETARLVEDAGRSAILMPGDIQDEQHCNAIVDRAAREFGRLDVLVNNAAHQITIEDIGDLSSQEWDVTFRTNIYSQFYLCRAAIPRMTPGRRSSTPRRSTRRTLPPACSPTRRRRARSRTSRWDSRSWWRRRASG
jgi:NAD(P)-dependent dehydrogenase (short-subunit alcohol dehydrogenase family)